MSVNNLYGQEVKNADNHANSDAEEYIEREKRTEEISLRHNSYIDWRPDTLYFSDGRHYFFRRSPLSLKSGYSNVFTKEEVDLAYVLALFQPNYNYGRKGYTLTWFLRNDSLFIKDINLENFHIRYLKDDNGKLIRDEKGNSIRQENIDLPRDTIIARLEKFTGSKFENGLMFIDWITGDFGIITDYHHDWEVRIRSEEIIYAVENGFIVRFKDGLFVKMKKDKRKNKH